MIVLLQCFDCIYGGTLKQDYEESFEGVNYCSQFTDGIPKYVEEGTHDCPAFEEKV